jgi:hypothetical protein
MPQLVSSPREAEVRSAIERIAVFAVSARPEHLSSDVQQLFKRNILDSLGCAIAGLQGRPFQALSEQFEEYRAPGRCTMIGGGKTSADQAALFNSSLVRYVDLLDSYMAIGGLCHPTWFASPRSSGDDGLEIVRCVEYLRSRHECGLLRRQISRRVLMELGGIEVRETICRLLYRTRLAEVTREALSVVGFVLSSVWHVRCNVHQSSNRWIRARFRNYGSPIAVCDKDARSVLQCEDTLHGGHIIMEGCLRLLDDADFEAIPDKVVVNAPPARSIRPGTVDEDDISHVGLLSLYVWCAPHDDSTQHCGEYGESIEHTCLEFPFC